MTRCSRDAVLLVLLTVFLAVAVPAAPPTPPDVPPSPPPVRYRIVAVGPREGASRALSLNDQGWVVGVASGAEGRPLFEGDDRPFLWRNGRVIWLTLPSGHVSGAATGVNDRGQIVGSSRPPYADVRGGVVEWRALFWQAGTDATVGVAAPRVLRTPPERRVSGGVAINARGEALLWTRGTDRLYQGGRALDTGQGGLRALNDAGATAGAAPLRRTTSQSDAFTLARPGAKPRRLPFLPGGRYAAANAINGRGDVAGSSETRQRTRHAVLWRRRDGGDAPPVDIGALLGSTASEARGMNDQDDVVGVSADRLGLFLAAPSDGRPGGYAGRGERAFLWRRGRLYDLNACVPAGSGWTLRVASAVNRRGEIAGWGEYWGRECAFLLVQAPGAGGPP